MVIRPYIVLHLYCSVWVNVPKNCRPFLPNHFLWLLYFLYVACYMIWIYYLPLIWSVWAHCIYFLLPSGMGCLIHGSAYFALYILCYFRVVLLSTMATAMACTATLAASATMCSIASVIFVCWVSTICICIFSASIFYNGLCPPTWDIYFWHHVVFLDLVRIILVDAYICLYCYYVILSESALLHVYVVLSTLIVHSSGLYTWCLLAMLITSC